MLQGSVLNSALVPAILHCHMSLTEVKYQGSFLYLKKPEKKLIDSF